jgi:hypothetical protein
MLPIRNFVRPRTTASLLRGSVRASSQTCSAVTGTPADRIRLQVNL